MIPVIRCIHTPELSPGFSKKMENIKRLEGFFSYPYDGVDKSLEVSLFPPAPVESPVKGRLFSGLARAPAEKKKINAS